MFLERDVHSNKIVSEVNRSQPEPIDTKAVNVLFCTACFDFLLATHQTGCSKEAKYLRTPHMHFSIA